MDRLPSVLRQDNQPTATLIHAALTVVPIWVITYIFLPKVYRIYKLRNEKKEDK